MTALVDLIQRSRVQSYFGSKTCFFDAWLISFSFLQVALQKESFSLRSFHNITPYMKSPHTKGGQVYVSLWTRGLGCDRGRSNYKPCTGIYKIVYREKFQLTDISYLRSLSSKSIASGLTRSSFSE